MLHTHLTCDIPETKGFRNKTNVPFKSRQNAPKRVDTLVKTLNLLEKIVFNKTHTQGKGWSNTHGAASFSFAVVLLLNFFRCRRTERWLEPETAAKVARTYHA